MYVWISQRLTGKVAVSQIRALDVVVAQHAACARWLAYTVPPLCGLPFPARPIHIISATGWAYLVRQAVRITAAIGGSREYSTGQSCHNQQDPDPKFLHISFCHEAAPEVEKVYHVWKLKSHRTCTLHSAHIMAEWRNGSGKSPVSFFEPLPLRISLPTWSLGSGRHEPE